MVMRLYDTSIQCVRETCLEAAVEDELCEHKLVRALYGGCNAALQRHNSILVYIPAVSNTF